MPNPNRNPAVFYRILGPLEVLRGDSPIELGPPKQRAVLARLLLDRGRVVSTDRLIAAVWGDEPPARVSTSLQSYISNLRRLLRDEYTAISPIARRSPGYAIDLPPDDLDRSAFVVDAAAARRCVEAGEWTAAAVAGQRALSRWHGALLADLADEPWVQSEADELGEQRSECSENVITALLGLDQASAAVVEAEHLRRHEPLRERATWLHLLALYRAGRQTEAYDAYREHARVLADELGLEPSPSLRDLNGSMLRQEPWLQFWPESESMSTLPNSMRLTDDSADARSLTAERDTPEVAGIESPESRTGTALVGRAHELSVLDSVMGGPAVGAHWVALTGPAGIGKTRLAEETAFAWSTRGVKAIRTSCPEDDGTPPWWPLRAVIRALGADPDVVLMPPDTDADSARYAVYERLDQLIRAAVAQQRILFLIDDVQWADSSSLRWLIHLASTFYSGALTVVLTVRDSISSDELEQLLGAIARHPGGEQLAVSPLIPAEVGELTRQVSGDQITQTEALTLTEQTGGNPFFVSEYARLPAHERAAGDIPLAVRSVLGRRLSGVDAAVLQVIRTAAVIGDPLDIGLLARATRLDRDELADLLDDAADAQMIVADAAGQYILAHGLLRDEVLAGISPPQRQRLHARVADALQPGTADFASRRATHLLAAVPFVDHADVLDACEAAAHDAENSWQSKRAAEWWQSALTVFDSAPTTADDEDRRDDIVIARIAALARSGRRQTVLNAVDEGLVIALREGRTASAGRMAATLLRTSGAWPWTFAGDTGPLLTRLAGLETMVSHDVAAHVRILSALAVGTYYDIDGAVPDRLSARAIVLAERLGDPDVLADALLARALAFSGIARHAEESVAVLNRLATIRHRTERIDDVLRATLLTLAHLILGHIDEVAEYARIGIAGSDSLRLPVARSQLRWIEAALSVWHGDLAHADELVAHAFDLHRQTEMYDMGVGDVAMIGLRWEQGRLTDLGLQPESTASVMPWMAAARLAAAGQSAAADAQIAQTLRSTTGAYWTTHAELALLAHCLVEAGLLTHADALIARLEPVSRYLATFGHTGSAEPVALALARLYAAVGDRTHAREHLAYARELGERYDGRCTLLRCRLLEAELADAPAGEFEAIAADASTLGMQGVRAQAELRARTAV